MVTFPAVVGFPAATVTLLWQTTAIFPCCCDTSLPSSSWIDEQLHRFLKTSALPCLLPLLICVTLFASSSPTRAPAMSSPVMDSRSTASATTSPELLLRLVEQHPKLVDALGADHEPLPLWSDVHCGI